MSPEELAKAAAKRAAFDAMPLPDRIAALERRIDAARHDGRVPQGMVERWLARLQVLRDELTPPPATIIAMGVCYASLCTTMAPADAAEWLNANHPTGLGSRWQPASDNWFKDGQPNPCPCNRHPDTHQHMLFSC